jgi:hypothetical protein
MTGTLLVTLLVQTGALGLLGFVVVRGIPAIIKMLVHINRTLAKLTVAIIHLGYKIKNPQIDNDDELESLERELGEHMKVMPSYDFKNTSHSD